MRESRATQKTPARLLRGLAAVLGSLLLAVVAGEIVVRLAASHMPGVRLLAEPLGTRRREPQTFAELLHAYRDHLVPFRVWKGFRCNSLGFHDVEFRRERTPGTFRIVGLGDSFAYGNVTYGRSYLTLAEALLILAALERDGGERDAAATHAMHGDTDAPPVELDNLGVPASGLADYRVVWQLVGRALAPDLAVITIYLGNDPRDFADQTRFGKTRPAWQRSWLVTFLQRATKLARERWRMRDADEPAPIPSPAAPPAGPLVGAMTEVDDDDRPEFSDEAFLDIEALELEMLARPGAKLRGPDWDAFLAALGELVDVIERDGVPVVLALAPSRLQVHPEDLAMVAAHAGVALDDVDPDLPQRRIAEFAAARGVAVVDLTPALRRAASEGTLYRRNDTHWNVRGNAVAAAELATRLAALGVVPTATRR